MYILVDRSTNSHVFFNHPIHQRVVAAHLAQLVDLLRVPLHGVGKDLVRASASDQPVPLWEPQDFLVNWLIKFI